MSKPPSAAARSARPGRPLAWVQGLLCGAIAAILPSVAFVLAVLLWPVAAAAAADRAPGRPIVRSVGLCSAAACVAPARALLLTGHGWSESLALVSDLRVISLAWGAAAAGWLLTEVSPLAVRLALDGLNATRAARLRAERAKLAEQWAFADAAGDAPR
ncbi:MAG: hypothetical protein M3Y41_14900 [Pseudomonadota bacterium]|nr:hypothetical protein [Pseudomonadota bacterium]